MRQVVENGGDSFHPQQFVAEGTEGFEGHPYGLSGHTVDGMNGAEDDRIGLAGRAQRNQDHRELPDFLLKSAFFGNAADDGVYLAEAVEALSGDGGFADAQPGLKPPQC